MRAARPQAPAPSTAFAPALAPALALALVFGPSRGLAQTNVEPLRNKLAVKPIAAVIEGNLSGSVGNVEGIVAGTAAQLATASGPHFGFVYGKADFAQFGGETTMSRWFGHARYNYQLSSRLWYEVFGQVQNDVFQRLRVRNLWGTGPRYALYEGEAFHSFVGVAYMFEFEAIDPAEGAPDARASSAHRLSSYLSLSYAYAKTVNAGVTVYVQPRIDAFSDARVLAESAASFAITARLASKVSATLRYDSEPPTTVRPYDLELKNSLTLTF